MRFLQLFYMPVISLRTRSVIMGSSGAETGQEAVSGKGAMTKMDKENRGNWRRFCLPAGLVLCAAAILAAQTGCSSQQGEPVIAERTSQAEQPQGGKEISDAGGETEGTDAEEPEKRLAEQAEAPDRYETKLIGETMRLEADAAVKVPEVYAAPVLRVEREMPYTDEDFARFKEVVSEAEGIQWNENQYPPEQNTDLNSCTSKDDRYFVSFSKGPGGETPLIWLNQRQLSHGSGDSFEATDLSDMTLSAQEREQIEGEMQKKAEKILTGLGLEHFELRSSQWRALSRSMDYKWVPDGRYGLKLSYCRNVDGIPEPSGGGAAWGMGPALSQYVEFVYAQDGELVELKDINRGTVVKEREEEGFLLPFSAVTQIFEQYAKTYFEQSKPGIPGADEESQLQETDSGKTKVKAGDKSQLQAADSGKTKAKAGNEAQLQAADGAVSEWESESTQPYMLLPISPEPRTYILVSEVRLEYLLTYEVDQGNTTDRGRLEPVWSFYGDVVITDQNWDKLENDSLLREYAKKRNLLVSIKAADGQVVGF